MTDEKDPIKEAITKMTPEEKQKLAESMLNPVKFCRGKFVDGKWKPIDADGNLLSNKKINQVWRDRNPTWSDESLKSYLLPEDEE